VNASLFMDILLGIGTAKTLCVIVELNLSLITLLITNSACM